MKIHFIFSLLSALLIINSAIAEDSISNDWSLNDVTYIYPLPHKLSQNNLKNVQNYIPQRIISELPKLSVQYDKEVLTQMTHAVAIRIDPIHLQIRIVWQPLTIGPNQTVTTLDAAFHSFYQLSQNEFNHLLFELQTWKKNAGLKNNLQIPLNIHPLLREETSRSLAIEKLNEIFFKYCSPNNIIKVTAMVLRGANDMWAFMGFTLDTSLNLQPIKIPRTQTAIVQRYINQAVPFKFFENAMISPLHINLEDNLVFFLNGAIEKPILTETEILKALDISYRFENPRIYDADSLDCVSCHIAQSAREWINHQTISIQLNSKNIYQNIHFNLNNMSTEIFNTAQIRGLGYFGSDLAISQRVIHESAESADYLNQQRLSLKLKNKRSQK